MKEVEEDLEERGEGGKENSRGAKRNGRQEKNNRPLVKEFQYIILVFFVFAPRS